MDYKLFSFVLFSFVLTVSCRNLGNAENATAELNVTESWRKGRSQSNLVYVNLFSCAVRYDASCFVDAAGELFETKKNELLAQADLEAFKVTGRADPENSPSHVAKTIEQLISELSGLFRDGIANFFSGKEADDEDAVVDADDKNATSSRDVGAKPKQLKKKKEGLIHKIIHLVHKIMIGVVIVVALHYILKFLLVGLKFKYWLVTVGYLALHAIKLWINGKQKKHPSPIIHYEHAAHEHHYPETHHAEFETADDEEYGHHEPYWGREDYAHDLAYATQKPQASWWFG